jgi:hypothetical protein
MLTTQPVRTLLDHDTVAYRCLRLIERYAPLYMKIGGGAITGEGFAKDGSRRPKNISTMEQRTQVAELIKRGDLTPTEIARKVGVYSQLVHRMARRMGVRLPDGRDVNRMQPQQ